MNGVNELPALDDGVFVPYDGNRTTQAENAVPELNTVQGGTGYVASRAGPHKSGK